jgi:nucleoside-diphosphate-sugar epimerase
MKTLVIGCGYVGLPLALLWRDGGDEVTAWVHSPASATALVQHQFARVIVGSVAGPCLWREIEPQDRVVLCASSNRGGPEAYREVFLEGARMMAGRQPAARKIFVSSTSVYGQANGEIVTEDSPAESAAETGKILREAEEIARAGGAIVARSAGIYGRGRGVLWEKFKRGDAVIEGDGSRWINQIYRDDLVAALAFLMEAGRPGQVYNIADDEPVTLRDFYAWCAEYSGQPLPPSGPVNTNRKRGRTSKRVSNAKLRALGWRPIYANFRDGIAAMEDACPNVHPPGRNADDSSYSPR